MQITNRMYVDEKVILDLIKEDSATNKVKLDFIAQGLADVFEREVKKLYQIGCLMRIVDNGHECANQKFHFFDFRQEVLDTIVRKEH